MEPEKVTIATAGEHFLYLPLYYAADRNFFDLLPPDYRVEVDSESRSDDTACDMLLNTSFEDWRQVFFAVCDPTAVLHYIEEHPMARPVVLAGLVTNMAFWAVDRRTHEVRTVADLGAFDTVLAYERGTTSYRIAEHIAREARTELKIDVVEMGKEILALPKRPKGTLALSPNILEIDALLAREREFDILFDLGRSAQYTGVLVTALLTRQDVLAKHRALALGLAEALERALALVRWEDPEIIAFAMDRFPAWKGRVKSALERATKCDVFPSTVLIAPGQWEKAVQLHAEAGGRNFDLGAQRRASQLYEQFVGPIDEALRQHLAKKMPQLLKRREKERPRVWPWIAVGMLGLLVFLSSVATARWPGAAAVSALVGGSVVGLVIAWKTPLREHTRGLVLHLLSWHGLLVVILLLSANLIELNPLGWILLALAATGECSAVVAGR